MYTYVVDFCEVDSQNPITIDKNHIIFMHKYFSKHGLVVSGQNKMYMAGGEYPDGSASQAFWRYDPVLDVWQEMASMQTPRSELGEFSHFRMLL